MTQEYLKSILHYNLDTGLWIWLVSRGGQRKGDVAGTLHEGYIRLKIKEGTYFAHKLAFLYMTGKWPKNEVDHKDINRLNNKWSNLREATHCQNQHNRGKNKNNTSGYKGVCWHKGENKWMVRINIDKKSKFLGYYDFLEDAANSYNEAAIKYHKEFARVI